MTKYYKGCYLIPILTNYFPFFISELDLTSFDDPDFYIKESRDMVTVIQALLTAGNFEIQKLTPIFIHYPDQLSTLL